VRGQKGRQLAGWLKVHYSNSQPQQSFARALDRQSTAVAQCLLLYVKSDGLGANAAVRIVPTKS
jgi:hypothetical protein